MNEKKENITILQYVISRGRVKAKKKDKHTTKQREGKREREKEKGTEKIYKISAKDHKREKIQISVYIL